MFKLMVAFACLACFASASPLPFLMDNMETDDFPQAFHDPQLYRDNRIIVLRPRRSPEWGVQGVWYPDNSGIVTVQGKEIPLVQSKDGAHTLHGGGQYTSTFNTPQRQSNWNAQVGYTWRF